MRMDFPNINDQSSIQFHHGDEIYDERCIILVFRDRVITMMARIKMGYRTISRYHGDANETKSLCNGFRCSWGEWTQSSNTSYVLSSRYFEEFTRLRRKGIRCNNLHMKIRSFTPDAQRDLFWVTKTAKWRIKRHSDYSQRSPTSSILEGIERSASMWITKSWMVGDRRYRPWSEIDRWWLNFHSAKSSRNPIHHRDYIESFKEGGWIPRLVSESGGNSSDFRGRSTARKCLRKLLASNDTVA